MEDIQLGNKVKDVVTGFEGIATQRLEYIDGRFEIGVVPQSIKNNYPEVKWIPASQMKKIDDGIHIEKVKPILGFGVRGVQ